MVLFRVIYAARRLNAKSIGVQTSTLPLSLPLSLTHSLIYALSLCRCYLRRDEGVSSAAEKEFLPRLAPKEVYRVSTD